MIFEMIGQIERVVTDTFKAEVEADNPEEARDLLYEVLSDYPNSPLALRRLLKVDEENTAIAGISIDFADDEDEDEDDEDD